MMCKTCLHQTMCPALKRDAEIKISVDPYESFMLQHLRHYGLFAKRSSKQITGIQLADMGMSETEWAVSGNSDKLQSKANSSSETARPNDRTASFQNILTASSEQDHGFILLEKNSSSSDDLHSDSEGGEREIHQRLKPAPRSRQLLLDSDRACSIPRLREPQGLFTALSLSSPHRAVRWPSECQVIKEEIRHIEWEPAEPELFYQPTGLERTPMPVGSDKGRIVYLSDPATKTSHFTCACVGGSRRPVKTRTVSPSGVEDSALEFESRFESGNLQKAVRVGLHDYELTLRTDLYTTKHTQWFYFQVRNMKVGVTYRFTIVNLMKSRSLYSLGMRPLLYSERAAQTQGLGWHRAGTNIKYYCNQSESEGRLLHSLTWTCQFPFQEDTCYFAHCYPYTYTDLCRYLSGVTSNPATAAYCRLRVLCHSLAGNAVYVLTVTSPSAGREAGRAKRAVVVTARVHPGETNSSWVMQGFLEFLLGDSPDARLLRDTFVFKVVPMLNPDGVVVGNYRCSLTGRDLNRNYRTLLRDAFPCVWHTRNMVKRLMTEREVLMYCDLHGHSRKNNVFMYGCEHHGNAAARLHERVYPLMMSKNVGDKFSYTSCKFRVQKGKEGTGRVVMWKLGITNSYTMESTFGGSTLGNRKGTHFTVQDLKSLGYCLCDTLLDYCDPDQTKARQCLVELGAIRRKEIQHKLGRDVDSDASLSDVSESDLESSTSGSNSTESNDLPVHLLNIIDKKKHLKTRKERNRLRQQRVQSSRTKAGPPQSTKQPTPALLSEEAVQTGTRDAVAVSDSRKERKELSLEVVTATYLHFGGPACSVQPPVTDAEGSVCRRQRPGLFSSLRHRQPLMRQPVAVTAMQQPGSCPWPSPCGLDQGPLSGTGGSVPASHALSHRSSVAYPLAQCRVLPVLVLPLELLPPRHSRLSVRPAHRLKPCREAKAELLPVSATHHTMDASFTSSETQETLRKNQEKDGAGAVSVKEPSEPQRGTITDVHSSLPDTKKQELGTELPSRRLSLTAFPKAVEMGHGIPRIPSARPVLLEPLCPQRAQLQQLQSLSLAKATKSPPSSTENGPSDPNRT